MRIAIDTDLLHESAKVKTGPYVHDLNRLESLYKSAFERRDLTGFAVHEDALRRYVIILKQRAVAALTCKHPSIKGHSVKIGGRVFRWRFCGDCGHAEDI